MSTDFLQMPAVDDTAIATTTQVTVGSAAVLTVTNSVSYEQAGAHVTGLRALSKEIEAFFKEPTEAAHKAWKALTSKRKALIDPIEAQVSRLGREMAKYAAEQERLAREAAEAQAREAQAREQAAALAEAAGLEAAGLSDDALAAVDALLEPMPLVGASVVAAVPKVAGVSYREVWKHRIVDEALIPREYLIVNESAIGKVIAATKGAVKIPGVEVVVERVPVVR